MRLSSAWRGAGWRPLVLLAWLAALTLAAAIAARATFVADLSAFLPSRPTPEQALLLEQLGSGSAARLVLIGIEGGDAAARADASNQLARALRASGEFDTVANGDSDGLRGAGEFVLAHRYLLSPGVTPLRFRSDGLREGIADSLALLGTPAGGLIKPVLLRDPTGESVRVFEALGGSGGPRSEGGVWVSRQAARAILVATTRGDGADLDAQERALQVVQQEFAPQRARGLSLVVTGTGTFGVSTRATIKAEVERLALIGTVLMALLLWFALGSLRGLVTALVPVATGVLAGVAAVSAGFGQVHGVTLGFGTTLIGEAVDYAIYYLIQARPAAAALTANTGAPLTANAPAAHDHLAPHTQRWVRHNWPTVRLGLWTSVCGFAALLFSGFGSLAQLGLFSIAGLVAAALTTRYVFPIVAPRGAAGAGQRRPLGRFAARAVQRLARPGVRAVCVVITLAAAAALAALPTPWRAGLAALSPISAAELQRDAELRADLGPGESGSLLVLSAASEAQVLELAEAAGERLDGLVERGLLQGYDSPARLLPSPKRQLERRAALPDAATLRAELELATMNGPLPARRLTAFVDDVQAARTQAPLERAALQGTPLAGALDAQLMPGTPARPWRALLNLRAPMRDTPVRAAGATIDTEALRQALAGLPGAQPLHISAELNAMYARYLREAAWQATLGALGVLALLAWHLRDAARLARLCQPVAAALLIVIAALSAGGAALGILHLVGVLLVVAIGSNYALFFDHLRHPADTGIDTDTDTDLGAGADEDTLASLLLANLTTVLSFGLLAGSNIQALHAIGQVVAPGALLCLLLSAVFIPPRRGVPM